MNTTKAPVCWGFCCAFAFDYDYFGNTSLAFYNDRLGITYIISDVDFIYIFNVIEAGGAFPVGTGVIYPHFIALEGQLFSWYLV